MKKVFILSFCLFPGCLFGQSHPDPAIGIWYAKWGFSLVPIALGLVFHLLTLWVAIDFVRQCIRQGRFKRMSGLPFVGPIFICLGLWWAPSHIPVWIFLIPWGLEFLAASVSVLIQKITNARPT